MSKQVLIINITRMGDLVQTIPLLGRLGREWPGVQVDLLLDNTFAPMARLLPGIRHVMAYDFQGLINDTRTMAKDVVTLYREVSSWARLLVERRYDRVINLTFNRRSGLLATYIGAADIRGVTTADDGVSILHNPWFNYFVDMHQYRRFNRFNLVDIYALGGSGPGPHAALKLGITAEATDWAHRFLHTREGEPPPIAIQVGASEAIKAWRPEYFGRTMARLSTQTQAKFVLVGSKAEAESAKQALEAYRGSNGAAAVVDAVGHTDLPKLAALLGQCRLLLTNDTGPMHVAVGVGTPVIDLSVGHVDFNETGPYGNGHWVVQPDLPCAPCGFDQVCPHHACKDRLLPEEVSALCLHALGAGPFPKSITGVRVYESSIDEDGLACYRLQAGRSDVASDWYGTFWRQYWYATFTGERSAMHRDEPAPDLDDHVSAWRTLQPFVMQLVQRTTLLARLTRQHPLPAVQLKSEQSIVSDLRQRALEVAMPSQAFAPVSVALLRDLHNGEAMELTSMADHQAAAYRTWSQRLRSVMDALAGGPQRQSQCTIPFAPARLPLLMP